MTTTTKAVGIIGTGNLGAALATGLARAAGDMRLLLSNRDAEKSSELVKKLRNAEVCPVSKVAETASVIIVAVKPPAVLEVMKALREVIDRRAEKPLLVSVAGSPALQELRSVVGHTIPLARVMPSIAVAVGAGISAVYSDSSDARDQAGALFKQLGSLLYVRNEQEFDAVLGVTASGLGFLALVAEALADGGVKMGLPREEALRCAAHTVAGAGLLLETSGMHPAQLRDKVASPGGTTIAGLHKLEKAGVRGAFIDAIEAAVHRARER